MQEEGIKGFRATPTKALARACLVKIRSCIYKQSKEVNDIDIINTCFYIKGYIGYDDVVRPRSYWKTCIFTQNFEMTHITKIQNLKNMHGWEMDVLQNNFLRLIKFVGIQNI